MATYSIQGDTLKGMADSIRAYKGENPDNPLEITHKFNDSDSPFYYNFPGAKSIKITIQEFIGSSDLIGVPYKTNKDWPYMTNKYKEDAFFTIDESQTLPLDVIVNNTEYITLNLAYKRGVIYGATLKMVIQAYDNKGELLPKVTKYTATDIANELSEVYSIAPKPEDLILKGDCTGMFRNGKFNWVLDKIQSTTKISNLNTMFKDNMNVTGINFDLNLYDSYVDASFVFQNCVRLEKLPDIYGTDNTKIRSIENLFDGCQKIKFIPASWENINYYNNTEYADYQNYIFQYCYNLRKISTNFLKKIRNDGINSYYTGLGNNGFYHCSTLEEINGYVIPNPSRTISSNLFRNTFYYCSRLKDLIFLKEEGTRGNLQGQTIDLRDSVGYVQSLTGDFPVNFVDKSEFDLITDDESYQRFKDSENSFACSIEYSRYNHDSAVRTINSLPDLSGNTGAANTIIFKGEAGSRTDGGAINTMTEEEIAVATAKGWVISFV